MSNCNCFLYIQPRFTPFISILYFNASSYRILTIPKILSHRNFLPMLLPTRIVNPTRLLSASTVYITLNLKTCKNYLHVDFFLTSRLFYLLQISNIPRHMVKVTPSFSDIFKNLFKNLFIFPHALTTLSINRLGYKFRKRHQSYLTTRSGIYLESSIEDCNGTPVFIFVRCKTSLSAVPYTLTS